MKCPFCNKKIIGYSCLLTCGKSDCLEKQFVNVMNKRTYIINLSSGKIEETEESIFLHSRKRKC